MKEIFITVCTRIADFLGIELQEFINQLTTLLFECFPKETEDVAIQKMDIGTQKKVLRDNITNLLKATVIYVITKDGLCTKIMVSNESSSTAFGFSLSNLFESNSISEVIVPAGATRIEEDAFRGTKIKKVILPSTVMEIGDWAFGSTDIKELMIPERVTNISTGMCHLCDELEVVTLPEGVTTIGAYAFSGCRALKTINIPDSVATIEREAFADCPNLPEDVKAKILEIGGEAAFTEAIK